MPAYQTVDGLHVLSTDELLAALGKLNNRKAGGKNVELIWYGGGERDS